MTVQFEQIVSAKCILHMIHSKSMSTPLCKFCTSIAEECAFGNISSYPQSLDSVLCSGFRLAKFGSRNFNLLMLANAISMALILMYRHLEANAISFNGSFARKDIFLTIFMKMFTSLNQALNMSCISREQRLTLLPASLLTNKCINYDSRMFPSRRMCLSQMHSRTV